MGFFGINQSKNASSTAQTTDSSYHSSDQGSRNTDNSQGASASVGGNQVITHADSSYDNHGTITSGGGAVTVTDGGAIAGAFDVLKSVFGNIGSALVGKSGGNSGTSGESHYDPNAAPASPLPKVALIAGGAVLLLVIVGAVVIARRK